MKEDLSGKNPFYDLVRGNVDGVMLQEAMPTRKAIQELSDRVRDLENSIDQLWTVIEKMSGDSHC